MSNRAACSSRAASRKKRHRSTSRTSSPSAAAATSRPASGIAASPTARSSASAGGVANRWNTPDDGGPAARTLPRVRDFKGVPDRSFDGRGNYSLGLREQVIFPEINLDKVDKIKGLTVVVCTTARTDAEAKSLLRALGMPFRA